MKPGQKTQWNADQIRNAWEYLDRHSEITYGTLIECLKDQNNETI